MSLNKVMLIGNVGKDPDVRYLEGNTQNGQNRKVASFTLATSERFKDRSGEFRENTEWHNIVAWGQPADIAEKYIKKGTSLYIEGRLRTRSWTDQSGVKKYTTEINVDSLQLLGRRDGSSDGETQTPMRSQGQSYQQPTQQYSAPSTPAQQFSAPQTDAVDNTGTNDNAPDDLPF